MNGNFCCISIIFLKMKKILSGGIKISMLWIEIFLTTKEVLKKKYIHVSFC